VINAGGFVAGVIVTWFVAYWLLKHKPEVAAKVGLIVGEPKDSATGLPAGVEPGPAAVDPKDLPTSLTNEEAAKSENVSQIKDTELRALVELLPKWKPRRHTREWGFHRSFLNFLSEYEYDDDDVDWQPRINARGSSPGPNDKYAIPDFILKGRLLVEIKKSFDMTATADRAVGQLTRYVAYWRKRGPSLLLICDEFDAHLRKVVDEQVRRWKALDIPVMAYYVRSPRPYDKR
jgi:hypothetical protein